MMKSKIRQWCFLWGLIGITALIVGCAPSQDPGSANIDLANIDLKNNKDGTISMLVAEAPLQLNRITTGFTALANEGNLLVIDILWRIVSKPASSRAVIINPDSATPSFRPDIVGEYVLRVIISQGGSVLADNEVTIVAGVNDLFPSKPANHVTTSDDCLACHVQDSWIIAIVDHTQILGACVSCHDGVIALGQSVNHLPTTLDCIACHAAPPRSWIPARPTDPTIPQLPIPPISTAPSEPSGPLVPPIVTPPTPPEPPVDHQGFVGNCIDCHNGKDAKGQPFGHIPATNSCDNCHVIPPAGWLRIVGVDHAQVVGTCVSCHDGKTGTGKSPAHIATSDACQACHLKWPNQWQPVTPSQVDHNEVLGMCGAICHTRPRLHVASWDVCDDCHVTKDWITIIGP